MEDVEFVSHEEYNAFVQRVQEEAAALQMEHRVRAEHLSGGRIDGHFEVFWDRWQMLGEEHDAMKPTTRRTIYPARWEQIVAEAANELAKS